MSAPLPDDTEQQLRRYLQRQHRADPAPGQTWQGVAARLSATTEGLPIMQNDTAHETPELPITLSEHERMQHNANPPRRGFIASAAGLAAVIVLALLARAVFTHGPASGTSSYRQVPSLVMSGLTGVSMVSATDGWAVGSAYTLTEKQSADGTTPPKVPLIFHYTGRLWKSVKVPDGLAGADLYTLAMHGANDGWAAGGYNEDPPRFGGYKDAPTNKLAVLLHYDGTAWHSVTLPQTLNLAITQLVYDPSGDVWAMATSANYDGHVSILHEHGGTWTVAHTGTYGGYVAGGSISMVSATDGWAVISYTEGAINQPTGEKATMFHLQNGVWNIVTTYSDTQIGSLIMVSATDGWANVTYTNKNQPASGLLHYTSGAWQPVTQAVATDGATIGSVLTLIDPTHGWFAGELGTGDTATYGYYTFDGTAWKNAHISSKGYFGAASFSSPSDGWFVGDGATNESLPGNGTISYGFVFAHYHNGTWTETAPSKNGK